MSTSGDVTFWIGQLKLGDRRATQAIWDHYFERLAHFARQKLDKLPRRVADEEDAALSALHSFCRGAEAGRFPQLSDRHDLWLLLMTIAARKVRAQTRRRKAEKRGGGKVRGESVFEIPGDDGKNVGIGQVLGREPNSQPAKRTEAIKSVIPDMLRRELVHAGVLSEDASLSTKLLAWIELA